MLDSMWRISAKNFDVTGFVEKFSIKNLDQIYLEGETGKRGKINETSGFSVLVSENLNSNENIQEIERFILNNLEAFSYLKNLGIESSIDIGCTVGTSDQFTKFIKAPIHFLGLLVNYGIELEFSAYPASDQESEP
jgi:hypothetical protein